MSVNFIKDVKTYTKDGKYYFSILYRNTGDDLGWRTETKEFNTERDLKAYVMEFCTLKTYKILPFSPFERLLEMSISFSKVREPKESYPSIFYKNLDSGCLVSSFKYDNSLNVAIKRTLIYLPKKECYKVSYSTTTVGDKIPESCKFTLLELKRLRKERPDLLVGTKGFWEGWAKIGKF